VLAGLPRLLGREFLIGFVLPATLFLLSLKAIDGSFDIGLLTVAKDTEVLGIVIVPFVIILIAILLTAINRPIIRTLEGYGKLNPLRLCRSRQIYKFNKEVKPVLEEKKRLDAARKIDPNAVSRLSDFSTLLLKAVTYYPDEAEFVLPTKFGNIMRAAEVYPRVVYEIESIQAWNRLQLLLPNRAKEQIKESRAMLDFIVNLLFLSSLIILVYLGFSIWRHDSPHMFIPLIALLTIVVAWIYLPVTATQWGETIKSVFDIHRGLLARNLGFTVPKDPEEEVHMWDQISRMMVFRSREAFIATAKYRKSFKRARRAETAHEQGKGAKSG